MMSRRRAFLLRKMQSAQRVLYDGSAGIGLDAFVVSNSAASSGGSSCSTSFDYESGDDIVIRSYNRAAAASKTARTSFRTTELIDFSGYTRLNFLVKLHAGSGSSSTYNRLTLSLGTCSEANKNQQFHSVSYLNDGYYLLDLGDSDGTRFELDTYIENEVITVDISNLSQGYVCCGLLARKHASGGSYAVALTTEVSRIWLE